MAASAMRNGVLHGTTWRSNTSYRCVTWILSLVVCSELHELESGLSITEWKPLVGALPPMNEAEWLVEFDKYRKTPEFAKYVKCVQSVHYSCFSFSLLPLLGFGYY